MTANGYVVSFGGYEYVPKLDSSNGCHNFRNIMKTLNFTL